MSGLVFTFVIGLFFILLSFIIKANPQLVTNYESLEEANEASKMMMVRNISDAFLIGGIAVFCIGVAAVLLKKDIPGVTTLLVSIFVPAYIFFKNKDLLKPASKTLLWIILIILLVISGLLIYSDRSSKITIENKEVVISGLHGDDIALDRIAHVEMITSIPKIEFRNNGYSRGAIKKGYFELKDWGECKLLLETRKAPYLLIILKSKQRIILNWKNERSIDQYYKELKTAL